MCRSVSSLHWTLILLTVGSVSIFFTKHTLSKPRVGASVDGTVVVLGAAVVGTGSVGATVGRARVVKDIWDDVLPVSVWRTK